MKLAVLFLMNMLFSITLFSQTITREDTVGTTKKRDIVTRRYGINLPDSVPIQVGPQSFVMVKLSNILNPASGSTNPAGSGNELQYRLNGTTFGAISNVKSNGTNILRVSDNSPVVYDNDVKGGAANLNSRLGVISNFASPNAGGVVSGQYYDNSFQGTASSTLAGVANQLDLAPYYTSVNLSIDQIGVAVSTGVASTNVHIVIYNSDANGWPNNKLYESGDLSTAAAGYAFASLSFTFSSGTQYWLGVLKSGTATPRTINVSSAVNLGLTSSTATNYATILRRTVTFGANACPSVWSFVNADRVANVTPPSIRFRAL